MVNLLKTQSSKTCYHIGDIYNSFLSMNKTHSLFPVTLKTDWQAPETLVVNKQLKDWLLDRDSLTARLKANSKRFRVEVLGEHIEACSDEEANQDIKAGEQVLVREVLLYCDEKPQVFARSLLPIECLTGHEKELASLGTQSLGQVLFKRENLTRKCIEVSKLQKESTVNQLANFLGLDASQTLWGRRSVFVVDNKSFMVAEVFLPNALAYQSEEVVTR